MSFYRAILVLSAAVITHVVAVPLESLETVSFNTLLARQAPVTPDPDGTFTCEGVWLPDFDDCRAILDEAYFPRGNEQYCLPPGQCRLNQLGNCQTRSCNFGESEFCPLNSAEGTRLEIILLGCEASRAGGHGLSVQNILAEVRDNPDFTPDPARTLNVTSSNGTMPQVHTEVYSVAKRQQEDDNEFRIFGRGNGVEQPGVFFQVSNGRLPEGTTVTNVQGGSQTSGWGGEISASSSFLGLVEASVGFSFDFSETVTNEDSVSIPVNCSPGQQGVIEWFPLFNFYQGTFQPSGDSLTVWEPVDNAASRGNYRVRCLG